MALPELLNTKELVEYLKISKAGVYRLIEQRKIPFYKVMGSIRFDKKDVEKYLEQNRIDVIR